MLQNSLQNINSSLESTTRSVLIKIISKNDSSKININLSLIKIEIKVRKIETINLKKSFFFL